MLFGFAVLTFYGFEIKLRLYLKLKFCVPIQNSPYFWATTLAPITKVNWFQGLHYIVTRCTASVYHYNGPSAQAITPDLYTISLDLIEIGVWTINLRAITLDLYTITLAEMCNVIVHTITVLWLSRPVLWRTVPFKCSVDTV